MIAAAWGAAEWAALGQVATAGIAIVAATVGFFQLREVRDSRREQIQPFVVVDIVPSRVWGNALNLVIENIGKTMAHEVRITFSPPIQSSLESIDLQSTSLLTDGIAMLPPGRRIETLFDMSHERINTDLPLCYDISVHYSDSRKRPLPSLSYRVDVGFLYGLQHLGERGMHDAATALREINGTLKKWNGSEGRLRIWLRDEDEDRRMERLEHDISGHYPSLGREGLGEVWKNVGRNPLVRPLVRWMYQKRHHERDE